jgi:nucleotide-binding universal stress UspA family protein
MSNRMTHHGIVVGVDGSPSSRMAVRWAAREAGMRNVPISLICAIDTPPWGSLALGGQAAPLPTETGDWRERAGKKIIADAIKVVEDSTGDPPAINTEMWFAPPVPTLVDLSKEAQMMVVGCRGQAMLRRILLGSVSSGLIHHAYCPVAVIHDEAPFVLQPSQLPVALGVDGSPASELATAIAFDEASFRGVELIALHAWSDGHVSDMPSMEWSAQQARAEEALAERLAGWQERYPDVAVHRRLVWDHPARHLLDEAESTQLLVVGSRGRGGFAGMLLGSVSSAVAQAARAPVIVARPR